MKLNDTQRDVLLLIKRSEEKHKIEKVSVAPRLWTLIESLPAELICAEGDSINGGFVSLSEKGRTVLNYL